MRVERVSELAKVEGARVSEVAEYGGALARKRGGGHVRVFEADGARVLGVRGRRTTEDGKVGVEEDEAMDAAFEASVEEMDLEQVTMRTVRVRAGNSGSEQGIPVLAPC